MRKKRTKRAAAAPTERVNALSDRHPGPSVEGPLCRQRECRSLDDLDGLRRARVVRARGGPASLGQDLGPRHPERARTLRVRWSRPRPSPTCSRSPSYRRWVLGNVFVFDPTGTIEIPDGTYPLRWSPVVGCDTFDAAVAMAHALGSAARPGLGVHRIGPLGRAGREPLGATALRRQSARGGHGCGVSLGARARSARAPSRPRGLGPRDGPVGPRRHRRHRRARALGHLLDGLGPPRRLPLRGGPGHDPGRELRPGPLRAFDRRRLHLRSGARPRAVGPLVVALLEQIRSAVYARPEERGAGGLRPRRSGFHRAAAFACLPWRPKAGDRGW